MPLFGWSHMEGDDNNNNNDDKSSPQQQRAALPPSAPEGEYGGHPSELDRLLAQARVGSHDYSAPASARRPSSPTVVGLSPAAGGASSSSPRGNNNNHGLDKSVYYTPAEKAAPSTDDEDDNDSNSTTEREDIIKIASDDDMESSDGSGIVMIEKPPLSTNENDNNDHHDDGAGNKDDPPASEPLASTTTTTTAITTAEEPNVDELNNNNNILAFPAPPKLRFFTDHQSVPTQLNELQQQAARKRHAFQTHLHNLHCHTAKLTAALAEEQMDCDLALRDAVDTGVYQPLQHAFERICLQRDERITTSEQWMALEQRVSQMDAQMTHAVHVQLQQCSNNNDNNDDDDITFQQLTEDIQETALEWKDEDHDGRKQEVTTARRWETQAGTMARRFQEERAAQVAATAEAAARLHQITDVDAHRGQELLDRIHALHAAVERERAVRQAEDARLLAYIEERHEALQQAILEAYPDL